MSWNEIHYWSAGLLIVWWLFDVGLYGDIWSLVLTVCLTSRAMIDVHDVYMVFLCFSWNVYIYIFIESERGREFNKSSSTKSEHPTSEKTFRSWISPKNVLHIFFFKNIMAVVVWISIKYIMICWISYIYIYILLYKYITVCVPIPRPKRIIWGPLMLWFALVLDITSFATTVWRHPKLYVVPFVGTLSQADGFSCILFGIYDMSTLVSPKSIRHTTRVMMALAGYFGS